MRKFLFLLFCLPSLFYGQQKTIDSLRTLLKSDEVDTNKLLHLYALTCKYEDLYEFQEAVNFGKMALTLAESILANTNQGIIQNRTKLVQSRTYTQLGIIDSKQGKNLEALTNLNRSLKISREIKNKQDQARTKMILGIV